MLLWKLKSVLSYSEEEWKVEKRWWWKKFMRMKKIHSFVIQFQKDFIEENPHKLLHLNPNTFNGKFSQLLNTRKLRKLLRATLKKLISTESRKSKRTVQQLATAISDIINWTWFSLFSVSLLYSHPVEFEVSISVHRSGRHNEQ